MSNAVKELSVVPSTRSSHLESHDSIFEDLTHDAAIQSRHSCRVCEKEFYQEGIYNKRLGPVSSTGLSSVGRACDCRSITPSGKLLVSRGRWFESDRPDFFCHFYFLLLLGGHAELVAASACHLGHLLRY